MSKSGEVLHAGLGRRCGRIQCSLSSFGSAECAGSDGGAWRSAVVQDQGGGPSVTAVVGADVICIVTSTGDLRQPQHCVGWDCAAGMLGPARVDWSDLSFDVRFAIYCCPSPGVRSHVPSPAAKRACPDGDRAYRLGLGAITRARGTGCAGLLCNYRRCSCRNVFCLGGVQQPVGSAHEEWAGRLMPHAAILPISASTACCAIKRLDTSFSLCGVRRPCC